MSNSIRTRNYSWVENLNIHSWIISCPDGITPNSGLTGPKNTIYIYIYIYIYICMYIYPQFYGMDFLDYLSLSLSLSLFLSHTHIAFGRSFRLHLVLCVHICFSESAVRPWCATSSILKAVLNQFYLEVFLLDQLSYQFAQLFINNWRGNNWIHNFPKCDVKCKQPLRGFVHQSLSPFPTTITCTPRAPPYMYVCVCEALYALYKETMQQTEFILPCMFF